MEPDDFLRTEGDNWKRCVDYCIQNETSLTEWEFSFVHSLPSRRQLTLKQWDWLAWTTKQVQKRRKAKKD
jgi:hypothetical protein